MKVQVFFFFIFFSRLVYAANKMYMSFRSHPTLVALQVNEMEKSCHGFIDFIIPSFIHIENDEARKPSRYVSILKTVNRG